MPLLNNDESLFENRISSTNFQLHQPRLWFITGGYLVKRWFITAAARARGQSNDLNREILASNLFNCHKEVINAPPVPSISRCIHIVYRHKNVWEYQWSNFIYNCMSTFLHYVHCKDALIDCSATGGERCESLTWFDEIAVLSVLTHEMLGGHFKCSQPQSWYETTDERRNLSNHDDVIKWKYFPRYWPFVRGIHRSPVDSPHKAQWRGAVMFSLMRAWNNDWANSPDAGYLRRHGPHYDVTNAFLSVLCLQMCLDICGHSGDPVRAPCKYYHSQYLEVTVYDVTAILVLQF